MIPTLAAMSATNPRRMLTDAECPSLQTENRNNKITRTMLARQHLRVAFISVTSFSLIETVCLVQHTKIPPATKMFFRKVTRNILFSPAKFSQGIFWIVQVSDECLVTL